jgi:hypothetical protein
MSNQISNSCVQAKCDLNVGLLKAGMQLFGFMWCGATKKGSLSKKRLQTIKLCVGNSEICELNDIFYSLRLQPTFFTAYVVSDHKKPVLSRLYTYTCLS